MLRGLWVAQTGESDAAPLRRCPGGVETPLFDGRILGGENLSKEIIGPHQLAGVERCSRFSLQAGHVGRITGSGSHLLAYAVIVLGDLDQPRRLLLWRNVRFAEDGKEGLQRPGADPQLALEIRDDLALVVGQLLLALQGLGDDGELFRRDDASDGYRGVTDVAACSNAARRGNGVCESIRHQERKPHARDHDQAGGRSHRYRPPPGGGAAGALGGAGCTVIVEPRMSPPAPTPPGASTVTCDD